MLWVDMRRASPYLDAKKVVVFVMIVQDGKHKIKIINSVPIYPLWDRTPVLGTL